MTGKVVFRIRPNSSISIESFKRALESLNSEDQPLFSIKAYTNKLIVRINDEIRFDPTLKVSFPDGKKLRMDSIIDFHPGHTGTHSENNGVFIIKGPKIKKGAAIGKITPYDVAPTVLKFLEIDIPPDMDGHVLKEIFHN